MRTFGFVAVAAAALMLAAPAWAADLGAHFARPQPVAPAAYDWTGVYVGGHIGGGWSNTTFSDPAFLMEMNNCCIGAGPLANTGSSVKSSDSGFLGGAQIGTMYQIGRLVVGSDFDWSGTNLNSNGSSVYPSSGGFGGPGDTATESASVNTKWTATATATVGLARDRWMLYSKAGVAWAHNDYGLAISGACFNNCGGPIPFFFNSTTSDTVTGWTVGTGLKWAVSDNWFLNLEYDFLGFGSKSQNLNGVISATPFHPTFNPAMTFTPTFYQNVSELKAGLNYKFGSGLLFW
jgi:outer membrane immunogenic protein